KQGLIIEGENLGVLLGGPVVFTVGYRGKGVQEVLDRVVEVYEGTQKKTRHVRISYGSELEEEIQKISSRIKAHKEPASRYSPRWLAVKLLENDHDAMEKLRTSPNPRSIMKQVDSSREHLQRIFHDEPENLIADGRYGFISGLLQECITLGERKTEDVSQKIDKVLTNKLLGIPLLVFFIWMMFQVTFRVGAYPMAWIESGIEVLAGALNTVIPGGLVNSLVVDGVISGVGGVVVFLPNILLLFLLISVIEDTGYMARAAFVMDRIMHVIGLHGKSFIPMIMGFGCNVPAIMAARTLGNRKDRILTILINPLMSCSARLPVYVLVAGTFFGARAGNAIFSLYVLGIVLAIAMGRLFRKTIFRGEAEPFVMELPPYRLPTVKSVIIHMWDRSVIFLKKMGTIILVGSIVIWFLSSFPRGGFSGYYQTRMDRVVREYQERIESLDPSGKNYQVKKQELLDQKQAQLSRLSTRMEKTGVYNSFIGVIGRFIEPAFRPLGFSWREDVALLTGFVAKEVIVSTMGVLYGAEQQDDGEESEKKLGLLLKEKSGLTPVSAYAFLVFVLIYTPCIATIAAIKNESGSWKWAVFSIAYEITLAWVMAFLIVQAGGILF
ncbi:MAG: ferrous iron transport protein B, partial [Spirochaetota bacterium]